MRDSRPPNARTPSRDRLLDKSDSMEMDALPSKQPAIVQNESAPAAGNAAQSDVCDDCPHSLDDDANNTTEYRVYKRRFFGLLQLVLLNVIVSWDVRLLSSMPSRVFC